MTEEVKRLVKALRVRCAEQSNCNDCPKLSYCRFDGDSAMRNEAADLIESLSAELEKVKRERDAAVEDMERGRICCTCKHEKSNINEEPCNTCTRSVVGTWPNWQWRGVKE